MEIKIVIDDRIIDVGRAALRPRNLLVVGLLGLTIPALVEATSTRDGNGLFSFTAGDAIVSAEVNENFTTLGDHMSLYEDAIAVDEDLNVGVGAVDPQGKLHVRDDVILEFGASACPPGYHLTIDADGSGGANRGDTCSADGLVVTPRGRVGIGTVNPGANLHLMAEDDSVWSSTAGPTEAGGAEIEVHNPSEVAGAWAGLLMHVNGSGDARARVAAINPGPDRIDASHLAFSTEASNQIQERVRITADGDVGIGTTAPTAKLDVAGTVRATGDITGRNLNIHVWTASAAGAYDLQDIFDDARRGGLRQGLYDCALRTDNEAHWQGYRFTAAVNAYIDNPTYVHQYYDIRSMPGHPSGCSTSIYSETVSQTVFSFSFTPGSCNQKVNLYCTLLN